MSTVTVRRPALSEHNPYYAKYVNLVPDGDYLANLEGQGRENAKFLRGIAEEKSRFRYAPDKWSIREVVGHLIDAERVFAYRAMTFARGDATPLPSFDENAWAAASNAGERPIKDLVAEFEALRAATLSMFRGFTEEQFARSGVANNSPASVRAIAFIIAGHERHHIGILHDRYAV